MPITHEEENPDFSENGEEFEFIQNEDISQVYCVILKNGMELFVNKVAECFELDVFILCNALKTITFNSQNEEGQMTILQDLIPWLSHVKDSKFFLDKDDVLIFEEASEAMSNLFYSKVASFIASNKYGNAFTGVGSDLIEKTYKEEEHRNQYPDGTKILRELDKEKLQNKSMANVYIPNSASGKIH